jgi:hypothetical protein
LGGSRLGENEIENITDENPTLKLNLNRPSIHSVITYKTTLQNSERFSQLYAKLMANLELNSKLSYPTPISCCIFFGTANRMFE